MLYLRKYYKPLVLVGLLVVVIFLGHTLYIETPGKVMTVAFLNIGQGDSIYIESPTHRQIIIDAGPNQKLLSEIGKIMPWYDHSIDAIVLTNPDLDHYGGFIDLLKRYKVDLVIEPGTVGGAQAYKTLESLIADKNIKKILARRGMSLELGGGVHLDILFPDRDVSKLKPNDGSILAQLVYGSTTVMFTGDAPNATEEYVLALDKTRSDTLGISSTSQISQIKSDVLKVGHHGSRTSASEPFVSAVAPTYAVISAGLNNRYGHPHQETLDLFKKLNIQTLVTFKLGTIIFKSDGVLWTSARH